MTNEIEIKNGESETPEVQTKEHFILAYKPYDFSIAWEWNHPLLARVGFMHDDLNHPFIKHVKSTARKQHLRIMHLSTEGINEKLEDEDVLNLLDFELLPTEEGLDELEQFRMDWVQLYLKLISYLNNRNRVTFIPQMKYYRHQEGPLAGYLRSIDELPESEEKNIILSHIKKLTEVRWGIKYNSDKGITDFIYEVKGESFKEKLESLFIGAWSVMNVHYARNYNDQNMDSLLTLLQFGKNFINDSMDETGRSIVEQIVERIVNLTQPSLDELSIQPKHALLIQSPQLFPNHYKSVSHMFYALEQTTDFDLRSMISDLKLIPNQAIYRTVVAGQRFGEEFVRKVNLAIES